MKKIRTNLGRRGKILFAVTMVVLLSSLATAGLLSYFGKITTTANVSQSVQIDGHNWDEPITEQLDATGGCCYCFEHEVTNNGCEPIYLEFISWGSPDLVGIDVSLTENTCIYLPPQAVTQTSNHWGTNAYFDTTLTNVPSGYIVEQGETYNGWCVDQGDNMPYGVPVSAMLWCSYDDSHPWQDDDWDIINWMINNKPQGMSASDLQSAYWAYIDGGYSGSDPAILQYIADGATYGEGFYPEEGDLIAILVDCGPDIQYSFIEVVVPECTCVCGRTPMEMPFWLNPGETLEFCICYDFDMLIMPGTYEINSKLVPATEP